MAAQEDTGANFEQEWEIPVFKVVKNNIILNNIFLMNSPSSVSETHREDSSKTHQDLEQTLLVGRHPYCDIRLEHPSISRFHLQIHFKPSSKSLCVTDLSSVHGTWISGKRLEPNIRVDVNEGDALRIGGSIRVYSLHWIPFNAAYGLNNPFVSPLGVPPPDEEKEEEMKRDKGALVLENEAQSADSAFVASKDFLYDQFETSKEMEDANTLLCENEDDKPLVSGCECFVDSALEALKALVCKQFETSKETEDENALAGKNEDEKSVDSTSEPSKYLVLNPNFKPSEEVEVLSVAPLPEAMKAVNMPLESRDMQFVNSACKGSEMLLLDKGPQLVALEGNEPLHTGQEDHYSHNTILKHGEMPLMLKLKDNMNFSGVMEEDEGKKGSVSRSSTGPLEELDVDPSEENEEYETTSFAECTSSSLPIESVNESHHFEEENVSSEVLLFLQESSPNEVQWESHSGLDLISDLMEDMDGALNELFADEIPHRNEQQTPPCNDEEQDGAWSFWSLSSQGKTLENYSINIDKENQEPEDENVTKKRNSLEDPTSGVIESYIWSFWSMIAGTNSADSSSLSDSEILSQVDTQSTSQSPQFLHPSETLCRKPSEEGSPDRAASSIWSKRGQSASASQIQTNGTLQGKICFIGINNEAGMLNEQRYEPITRAFFAGVDLLEEDYFTPKKENYTLNTRAAEGKSGEFRDSLLPCFEKSPLSSATAKASIDSEKSLSVAHFRRENKTPKVLQKRKSARHPSEEHTKLPISTRKGTQRTPLQTLFADSPQKSISQTHFSGASSLSYSNKENQTPEVLKKLHKPACHPSAEDMKSSMLVRGVAQRMSLQTLFSDSPQKSINSKTHISGGASLSACSNKENQTPKFLQEQKSSRHSSAEHTSLLMLRSREAEKSAFRTLFVDSPQKCISDAHISGSTTLSACSNKENETSNFLQEEKSATHSSAAEHKSLFMLRNREAERSPFRTLFVDSPQKSISDAHMSGSASLSACSNRENQTPKFLQKQKSARHSSAEHACLFMLRNREAERSPFRTLFVDSPQKSISDAHILPGPVNSRGFTNHENCMDKNKYSAQLVKRWTMVADIACLLNKNSREALKLLEGIKGTQLVIPRAVVQELYFMKQQTSIFRKNSDAFLASQWIEECLVRTNWWIQVQSSVEDDRRSTALAPRASCNTQSSERHTTGLTSYYGFGTRPQIVSPSTEDHVLNYALYLRRMQKDGQLILLSDNATMKIKAMEQGLICETAEEFRESLVNPFSSRFLWADSSPRGQTWSYLDDVILRQNFYPSALIKGVENAKGLKLLLLQNSIYR